MFRRGGGCWILGVCAVALGAGILIAAIFPVGALMFLVAVLLIACGCACCRREKGANIMRSVVWKSPKALSGILRKLFKISE